MVKKQKLEACDLSDERFIAFLRSRKPREKYRYNAGMECLICRALTEWEVPWFYVDTRHIYSTKIIDPEREARPLPDGWDRIVRAKPWTAGAALERALKILT